jgi:shikimate dehydrogenase
MATGGGPRGDRESCPLALLARAAVNGRLHFVGVATEGSSIFGLFPLWTQILGLDADMAGRDIPLAGGREAIRSVVEEIAHDERIRGALVTAHKVDVYRHASDLFDELDPYARLCREVSCISKRDDALVGHAKDPITAGLALEHMLGHDYWRHTEAQALCLGAGGAGTAITVHLLGRVPRPARVVVTDRDAARLDSLRTVHAELGVEADVDYHTSSSPTESDLLVARLPRGSLVVNSTGMGKDVPGSPITDSAVFPREAVVWELNYRGELDFLRQAGRRKHEHDLTLHDGWRYFLHGWTEVIAEVFRLELTPELFARLADAAEPHRPAPLA